MKKGIFILMFFLLSGIAGLYGKKISHIIKPKSDTKTVRFFVFAGTDYSTNLYKKSKARVILTICRFRGAQEEVVWEGVVDEGAIKNYPSRVNSILKEVSVYNVSDRIETLAAYYKVVYDYKGSTMTYQEGITLGDGSGTDSLKIAI